MKVICSYCRKKMPEKEPFDNDKISHTICPECYKYFKEQWDGLPLDKYLDKFNTPVLIMDEDCRVIVANKKAADLTGKQQQEVTGLLGGEAMECAFSRLPGGCGKTVHCETCTIRKAVKVAIESGEPQKGIPVKVQQQDGVVEMNISTEKIGELVRIIIDK